MSLEILTKAVEDHGAAVKSLAGKVDGNQTKIEEALDRLQDLEMKGLNCAAVGNPPAPRVRYTRS
ncbi:hypothetical protein [Pseudomonas sp. St316]|uniref:hypothetical protein n=1 Tax=Pseudomonas sp. St316 TaxID=2678257 RepID=UPI001BB417F8|nr:hypothetical protein [Pseudomonas sp. St316]BBP57794.1 hypothetical protein PHLH4_13840 [Pseudomonas sp. St316]